MKNLQTLRLRLQVLFILKTEFSNHMYELVMSSINMWLDIKQLILLGMIGIVLGP